MKHLKQPFHSRYNGRGGRGGGGYNGGHGGYGGGGGNQYRQPSHNRSWQNPNAQQQQFQQQQQYYQQPQAPAPSWNIGASEFVPS